MKRNTFKTLSVILCGIMLFSALPVCAALHSEDEFGQDKLLAFWQQEAYGGLSNGQAVYDHEWMDDVFYWNGNTQYNDTWFTDLVSPYGSYFDLSFYWTRWYGFEVELEDGSILSGEGIDLIEPDLYGRLDLSGTLIGSLGTPQADQTHLTFIDLENCPKLEYVAFNGQRHVTGFSALGSEKLEHLELKNDSFGSIAFYPESVDEPFEIAAFGAGSVGAFYDKSNGAKKATIYAYAESGFKGWYRDGVLYSHLDSVTVQNGGRFVACFGGDADGNGHIDAADALLTLRAAMGIGSVTDLQEADIDCSGEIGAADALAIMRFALGIY